MDMNLGSVRLGTDFFQAIQGLPKGENAPLPGAGAAAKAAPAAGLPEIAPDAVEAAESAARSAAEAGDIRPRGSYLDIRA